MTQSAGPSALLHSITGERLRHEFLPNGSAAMPGYWRSIETEPLTRHWLP